MQDSAPTARSRALVCSAIAIVYGMLVAFAVWAMFPTQGRIDADTAESAVVALQQSNEKYASIVPQSLRRRLYRGLTDEQVIGRIREYAASEDQRMSQQGGTMLGQAQDPARGIYVGPLGQSEAAAIPGMRPQIAVIMEELDQQRSERIARLPDRQRNAVIGGIVAWVIPVVALFLLAPRMSGARRKRLRRI
jgi:hypothetical protein